MNKIILGKYVNTHGIKGEIRIKSNFKYKDRVFKKGNEIIIDKPYKITGYRVHKDYDMITLEGINSIDEIISLKGSLVYINRDKYLDNIEYVDDDLIGMNVFCNSDLVGKVNEIRYLNLDKKLLVIDKIMIPFELILDVNLNEKIIVIKYVEGLI